MQHAQRALVRAAPLRIAADCELAPDTVSANVTICAAGTLAATRTALVLVEEMLAASCRVIVIDPVGVCAGMRLVAEDRLARIPIPVLGGTGGRETALLDSGEALAVWLEDAGRSVVLDLSGRHADEQQRLMTNLLGRLTERHRSPLHVFFMAAESLLGTQRQPREAHAATHLDAMATAAAGAGIGVTLATVRPYVIPPAWLASIDLLLVVGKPGPAAQGLLDDVATQRLDQVRAAMAVAEIDALERGQTCVVPLTSDQPPRRITLRRLRTFQGLAEIRWEAPAQGEFWTAIPSHPSGLSSRELNMLTWLVRRADQWFGERQRADAELAGAFATLAAALNRVQAHGVALHPAPEDRDGK